MSYELEGGEPFTKEQFQDAPRRSGEELYEIIAPLRFSLRWINKQMDKPELNQLVKELQASPILSLSHKEALNYQQSKTETRSIFLGILIALGLETDEMLPPNLKLYMRHLQKKKGEIL